MSWSISIEDSFKNNIASFPYECEIEDLEYVIENNEFKLLQYLDPYGDTIFNQMMVQDLIEDLQLLASIQPHTPHLDELIAFANSAMDGVHQFLVFYGD